MEDASSQYYEAANALASLTGLDSLPRNSARYITAYSTLLSLRTFPHSQLKRMVAAAIPKHFKLFPAEIQEAAVNAHLDLCEDDDTKVRLDAMRYLSLFAKDTPNYIDRIADVLVQLLQSESPDELQAVKVGLGCIWKQSSIAVAKKLRTHFQTGSVELRSGSLGFLQTEILDKANTYLESSESLDCLLELLRAISSMETLGGHAESIRSIVMRLQDICSVGPRIGDIWIDLEAGILRSAPFDFRDDAGIRRLMEIGKVAHLHLKRGASSPSLLLYLVDSLVEQHTKLAARHQVQLIKLSVDLLAESILRSEPSALLRLYTMIQKLFTEAKVEMSPSALATGKFEALLYGLYLLEKMNPNLHARGAEFSERIRLVKMHCAGAAQEAPEKLQRSACNTVRLIQFFEAPIGSKVDVQLTPSWHRIPVPIAETQPSKFTVAPEAQLPAHVDSNSPNRPHSTQEPSKLPSRTAGHRPAQASTPELANTAQPPASTILVSAQSLRICVDADRPGSAGAQPTRKRTVIMEQDESFVSSTGLSVQRKRIRSTDSAPSQTNVDRGDGARKRTKLDIGSDGLDGLSLTKPPTQIVRCSLDPILESRPTGQRHHVKYPNEARDGSYIDVAAQTAQRSPKCIVDLSSGDRQSTSLRISTTSTTQPGLSPQGLARSHQGVSRNMDLSRRDSFTKPDNSLSTPALMSFGGLVNAQATTTRNLPEPPNEGKSASSQPIGLSIVGTGPPLSETGALRSQTDTQAKSSRVKIVRQVKTEAAVPDIRPQTADESLQRPMSYLQRPSSRLLFHQALSRLTQNK
ncbi:apoptosis inhibitory protein 5-domain-containing protein [Polychytrium aggregatum]|uniref:apoptosis inhibitory protein 5-domain-containing protein n=1 Tax=Polychytrium aggregatum TaxID=110093 RepID=UPI0022FE8912|nr:apoptosis inhibitory protein 5-domain-containing protein [Polychytrium aggregatum]KAI9208998.1 apoptosis inhibitory protein 5-domain-containing protein [Polychytrium aggregatum]